MRKLILILALVALSVGVVCAQNWGMWDASRSWIAVQSGNATNWYSLWDTTAGTFQGANLGSYNLTDTLQIEANDVKTWKNSGAGGDVTAVEYFYKVYSADASSVSFTGLGDGWMENLDSDGNQKWGNAGPANVDLLSGLTGGKTYTLEVYGQVSGTSDPVSPIYDNNGGANFTATFTTIPEPSTMALIGMGIGAALLALRRIRK